RATALIQHSTTLIQQPVSFPRIFTSVFSLSRPAISMSLPSGVLKPHTLQTTMYFPEACNRRFSKLTPFASASFCRLSHLKRRLINESIEGKRKSLRQPKARQKGCQSEKAGIEQVHPIVFAVNIYS